MIERPILFSAPMIRALLAGTKSQTRRLVKVGEPDKHGQAYVRRGRYATILHPTEGFLWRPYAGAELQPMPADRVARYCPFWLGEYEHSEAPPRLWVREAWRTSVFVDTKPGSVLETAGNGYGWPVWYAADNGAVTWRGARDGGPGFVNPGRYRHARFMPRWASRIVLEVTSVRAERLQSITEEDAIAEGARHRDTGRNKYNRPRPGWSCCDPHPADLYPIDGDGIVERAGDHCLGTARHAFGNLWNSINEKKAPWSSNPWIWRIEFRRVDDAKAAV